MLVRSLILLTLTALLASPADARSKKKKKAVKSSINMEEVQKLLTPFKFGMSKEQVERTVAKQLRKKYEDKIRATSDVFTQDKLRADRGKELKKFQKTWLEFKGQSTGWDASFLDDQFFHNTDEAMMIHWERKKKYTQRRVFFFHKGELYKIVVALDTRAIGDRSFEDFTPVLKKRYGNPAKATASAITWFNSDYVLQAQNKIDQYQVLTLVVSHTARTKRVLQSRKKNPKKVEKIDPIINKVTSDPNDDGPSIENR